jgi:hypothetical protein
MCLVVLFHRLLGTEPEMMGMMDVLEFAHEFHTWVHHPRCTHVRSTSVPRCSHVARASPIGAVGTLQHAGPLT